MKNVITKCKAFGLMPMPIVKDKLMSRPAKSWVRGALLSVLCAGLIACSSQQQEASNSSAGGIAPHFSDSTAVNERFGTRTTRVLNPQVTTETQQALISAINQFSFDLHRVVSTDNASNNTIESGYSASMAFALASAATDANTYSGLSNGLGFSGLNENDIYPGLNELSLDLTTRSNDKLVLRSANRVFVKPNLTLNTGFLDTATAHFGAPITEADFDGQALEVVEQVNRWVSNQTEGFIPKIIDSFAPGTVFSLLNSIFLDAAWEGIYSDAGDHSFTRSDGSSVEVPHFTGRSYLQAFKTDELVALEIPYAGKELAMLILMPNDLAEFESSFSVDSFNSIKAQLQEQDVDFLVPNWEAESNLNLMSLLTPVGLPANPWRFDRLAEEVDELMVMAIQRARIEVDKDGTRAAAVTLVAGDGSVPEQYSINRPFMYVLHDKTSGAVLFTGRVVSLESS